MTIKAEKKVVFSLFFISILLSVFLLSGYIGSRQGNLSANVLRLHILGNTNNSSDQELKLLVRDSILTEYNHIFAQAKNTGDAIRRAQSALTNIQKTAEETLRKHGCSAPVSAQVEETFFPTKHYGSVSLPAGNYAALNIRIGKAAGENWWCVLYPPLCLTEGTVTADQESLRILKENLSHQDFALLTQPDKVTFRVKFKLLELFGNIFSSL